LIFVKALDEQDSIQMVNLMLEDSTFKLIGLNFDFVSL